MKYAVVSAINLAILLVGLALGLLLAPHLEKAVHASVPNQALPQTAAPAPNAGDSVAILKTTPIQPTMSAGSAAIYLVLAHQIQSDQLVVNGIDLLKLHQEELNLLSKFVPAQEINNAVSRSKATEVFQSVNHPVPAPAPAPK